MMLIIAYISARSKNIKPEQQTHLSRSHSRPNPLHYLTTTAPEFVGETKSQTLKRNSIKYFDGNFKVSMQHKTK